MVSPIPPTGVRCEAWTPPQLPPPQGKCGFPSCFSSRYSQAPGYALAFPFAHKRPQNATAVNDVAIMVLKQPVPGITPVRVAGPGEAAFEQSGQPVRVLGYGVLAAQPNNPFP